MAKITYMPTEHDADQTVVAGISFTAYQAVDVPNENVPLIEKLKANPWFTDGDPEAQRKQRWELVRNAHMQAEAHRKYAKEIEENPNASDFATSLRDSADKILGEAQTQAQHMLADAQSKSDAADKLLSDATRKATEIAANAESMAATGDAKSLN